MQALGQRTPRYLRIYHDLKGRIDAGDLLPGSRLPAQRALCRSYDVTLMTLRQAIGLLEQEGLLVTRHGAGTFVAPKRVSYDVRNLRSLAEEMAAQGLALTTRVLARAYAQPGPLVAEQLRIGHGEDVLVLERLRLVAGEPAMLQRSQLPEWVGRRLGDADLSRSSLYGLLDGLGVAVTRARETLHAVVLGDREAGLLDEASGAPALVSKRVTYTSGERPIIYDEALMPGDRVVVSADRINDDLTLGYELRRAGELSMT